MEAFTRHKLRRERLGLCVVILGAKPNGAGADEDEGHPDERRILDVHGTRWSVGGPIGSTH